MSKRVPWNCQEYVDDCIDDISTRLKMLRGQIMNGIPTQSILDKIDEIIDEMREDSARASKQEKLRIVRNRMYELEDHQSNLRMKINDLEDKISDYLISIQEAERELEELRVQKSELEYNEEDE